jgi:hypothetical protein
MTSINIQSTIFIGFLLYVSYYSGNKNLVVNKEYQPLPSYKQVKYLKTDSKLVPVAYACNFSYLGD